MSSENDVRLFSGSKAELQKQSKVSYTRDFLLSFSALDTCKNLPSEFDASVLSEFEDALFFINESQRSQSLPLHSSRMADFGSLLPNTEGLTSYSRGNSGKWEVISAVSSNRDGDPADRDTSIQDSARRFSTQLRCPSPHTGQDGLLGSGSFPRPPGYVGYSSPRGRGTSHSMLSRTTEPYQPPRPYKAVPFQRKGYTDSRNDETFGSAECTGEDRTEERKRRESFEIMRKEQQKALHEKQKEILDNRKEKLTADVFALSDSYIEKKSVYDRSDRSDGSPLVPQNDSSKLPITRASTFRPIAPPGFASLLDLNSSFPPSSNISAAEDRFNLMKENVTLNARKKDRENGNQSDSNMAISIEEKGSIILCNNKNAETIAVKSSCDQEKDDILGGKYVGSQKIDISSDLMVSLSNSTSILEKLFGSAISNQEASGSENELPEIDEDTLIPARSKSSKFADWFLEEDKKPAEDFSSKILVDLIVNNNIVDSPSSVVTDERLNEQVQPISLFETEDMKLELYDPSPTSSKVEISEHLCQASKLDPNSGVLTCKDLEQLILAKVKDSTCTLHPEEVPVPSTTGRNEKQKVDADDHASQHLLSLLQNKTKKDGNMTSVASPKLDNVSFGKGEAEEVNCNFGVGDESAYCNYEIAPNQDRTLTLEALFGAAFISELKSAETPVSTRIELDEGIKITASASLQHSYPDFVTSSLGNYQNEKSMHEAEIYLNHNHGSNAPYNRGSDVNFRNSLIEGLKPGGSRFRDQASQIHLQEEDSLINVSDSLLSVSFDPLPCANARKTDFLPKYTVEQLDAYSRDSVSTRSLIQDGLTQGSSQDLLFPDSFYHVQGTTSSRSHHLNNQMRPSFPEVDHITYRNQQINFLGPHTIHNDFTLNIAPRYALSHTGVPQYDDTMNHSALAHLSIPGNFSPQFPIRAFSRGITPSYPVSHMQNIPEMNNVHNFSFHKQQDSGDHGRMAGPPTGAFVGSHPEAFQRIIDLQLRTNAKHVHPATAGRVPAIYNPDSGMNFRYR